MTNPITQYRARHKLTQCQLASLLGISPRTLQRYEAQGIPEAMAVILPLALQALPHN